MWSSASWIGAAWLWIQEAIMEQNRVAATFLWVIKEKALLDFTLKRHCVSNDPNTEYLQMSWQRIQLVCPAIWQQRGVHTAHGPRFAFECCGVFHLCCTWKAAWTGSTHRVRSLACGNWGSSSLYNRFARLERDESLSNGPRSPCSTWQKYFQQVPVLPSF